MKSLLLRQVLLPGTPDAGESPVDVLVADGTIERIAPTIEVPEGAEVIDGKGLLLLPGLCDVHVHLREPGREDSETMRSGTEAAIAGGFSRVLAMPNTDPPIDTGGMVTFVQSMASRQSRIPVSVAGCLTCGREGGKLAEIADMEAQGAVMVTDCDHALKNEYVLRRALEYTRHFDVIVGTYPDTPSLSKGGVMHEGKVSFRLGLQGIPAMAEEIAIERDLRVVEAVGGRIHIQNVSTAGGVESIRRFKQRGTRVTAETTPHHLLLNHEALEGYHPRFKVMPPLRAAEDQAALLEGIKDGTIDMIATGHAPHTDFEKNLDFDHAPFGVIGLETALPALFTSLIEPGLLSWADLVRVLSDAPRKLLKLDPVRLEPGARLEAFLFDPSAERLFQRDILQSRSFNSPWLGEILRGKPAGFFAGGQQLLPPPDLPS